MLITHGNIQRASRIPPEFVWSHQDDDGTGAIHTFDYYVHPERDLLVATCLLYGVPTLGENVASITLSVHPFGLPDSIIVAMVPAGAANTTVVCAFDPGGGLYIPAGSKLHGVVVFNAAVTAKQASFNMTGWLVPAFDKAL